MSNLTILFQLIKYSQKQMQQSKFKKAQSAKVPDELVCPISQTIMRDPVFNDEDNIFDRKVIEQLIDKYGTDPLTLKPLSKKNLQHNRALREGIQRFVQNLSIKQKEQLQHLKVCQVSKLREKELEEIKYSKPSSLREVSKTMRQLETVKQQMNIQIQEKQVAIRQFQAQKKQTEIDRKMVSPCEIQNIKLKQEYQMLQLKTKNNENQIEQSKTQNVRLRNQKDIVNIYCQNMLQQIKTHQKENQVLDQENLELRHCHENEELQKMLKDCQCGKQKHKLLALPRKVKIIPDKQSRGLNEKDWKIDNTNSNVCIVNKDGPNWLCSSPLPSDGEFVFTIRVIKLTFSIRIGSMENEKKGDKWEDTFNYSVYLNPFYQNRLRIASYLRIVQV